MSNMKPPSNPRNNEKKQAALRLMHELRKGRKSGEEKGWLSLNEVESSLGVQTDKDQ